MNGRDTIESERLGGPRNVWFENPPAAGSVDVLIFLDGELYRDRVAAPGIVRTWQSAEARLLPLWSVYLAAGTSSNRQADFICNPSFADGLALDLVPWLASRTEASCRCWLCGLSLSGLAAAHAVMLHSEVFAGAICQSPSAWWNDEWLAAQLPSTAQRRRFWISVGDEETADKAIHPPTPLVQTVSQLTSCRRLAEKLSRTGNEVHFTVFSGGHDPACWAHELPSALSWLLAADSR